MNRFFPTVALAAFAFGIFNSHAQAQPVRRRAPAVAVVAPGRLAITNPPPQRASFAPAIGAPQPSGRLRRA